MMEYVEPTQMGRIRDGKIGIIEYDVYGELTILHFTEYWNGEGLQFQIGNRGDKVYQTFDLHIDDIAALVTAAYACGMVDLKECKKRAKEMIRLSEERTKTIESIREKVVNGGE